MCGRYVLTPVHAKALLAPLGVLVESTASGVLPPSRYTIPTDTLALLLRPLPGDTLSTTDDDGTPQLTLDR